LEFKSGDESAAKARGILKFSPKQIAEDRGPSGAASAVAKISSRAANFSTCVIIELNTSRAVSHCDAGRRSVRVLLQPGFVDPL
jgi:hypothetical protein